MPSDASSDGSEVQPETLGLARLALAVIGGNFLGAFSQISGSNSTPTLTLASQPGGKGNYSIAGGTLSVAGHEYVGYQGPGKLDQIAGTHVVGAAGGNLWLGYNAGASGNYSMLGGSLSVMSHPPGARPICSTREKSAPLHRAIINAYVVYAAVIEVGSTPTAGFNEPPEEIVDVLRTGPEPVARPRSNSPEGRTVTSR